MMPPAVKLHTVSSLSELTYNDCYNKCLELGFSKKYLKDRSKYELWDMIIGVGGLDSKALDFFNSWLEKTKDYTKIRYKVGKRK